MGVLLGFAAAIFIITWFVIDIGWQGWVGVRMYLGTPKRRVTDVSHLNFTPPPETKEMIATLESLGFHRLGEAQIVLPHMKPSHYWVLMNSDSSVQAETGFGRISFSTCFDDNVIVVTDYPSGEHLGTLTYQSHTITTSIKDALDYHQQQVDNFRPKYGFPHGISNMADYVHWETIGRVNYGLLKLKRFFWVDITRLAVFIYTAIIIMGLPLYLRIKLISANLKLENATLIMIGLTLPVLFVPAILFQWARKVSKRDSRNVS